jgi:hypothetical protein
LFGYRFERGLRQRGLAFAKFIIRFTAAPPARLRTAGRGVQASIAARDVVDGVTLLERWRTQGAQLIAGLTQARRSEPSLAERRTRGDVRRCE